MGTWLSHRLSSVGLVLQLTWLDLIRRKDFYVVAVFMLLFVVAAGAVRVIGIREASTARFLMSTGLALSHLLAAVLAASFSARCFPEEFERGTLAPLLAKPVSRWEVLAGKLLTCLSLALGGYVLFVAATLLSVPLVPGQRVAVLIQVAALQCVGLTALCAAAMAVSFHAPIVVSALVSLLWYFGAGFFLNAMAQVFASGPSAWLERLLACVPDATLLCQTECFASGGEPLGAGLFLSLALYGLVWAIILTAWAGWRLERTRI